MSRTRTQYAGFRPGILAPSIAMAPEMLRAWTDADDNEVLSLVREARTRIQVPRENVDVGRAGPACLVDVFGVVREALPEVACADALPGEVLCGSAVDFPPFLDESFQTMIPAPTSATIRRIASAVK